MTPKEAQRIRGLVLAYGHACYEEGIEEAHDSAGVVRARERTRRTAQDFEDALRVMSSPVIRNAAYGHRVEDE